MFRIDKLSLAYFELSAIAYMRFCAKVKTVSFSANLHGCRLMKSFSVVPVASLWSIHPLFMNLFRVP